jgi:hypothetical protein
MNIHIEVHRIGKAECSLTRKVSPGLEVTIEGEARCFLSWAGLKQLLNWKLRDAEEPAEELEFR